MVKFKVVIKGTRKGMLQNPKTPELLEGLRTGVRKPPRKDLPVQTVAERKIIRDSQGRVGVPDQYLWSCLVEAGRGVKAEGKRNISTSDNSLLGGFIEFECGNDEDFLPFTDQNAKWVPTMMGGKNPADGVATAIIRPLFRNWAIEFTLLVDEKEISPEAIRKLIVRAGKFVGLGDFRIACKGRFGGFTVEVWEQIGGDAQPSEKGKKRAEAAVAQAIADEKPEKAAKRSRVAVATAVADPESDGQ